MNCLWNIYIIFIGLSLVISNVSGNNCGNPKVTASSFSTQDATILTQLAHIGEFTLKCSNDIKLSLFAEFPCGKIVPVAQVDEDKYQISWTEDIRKSSFGDVMIRIFDEDGYTTLRKVQRDNGNVADVKSLVNIIFQKKNAYKGPWIKAELVAVIVAGGLAYFALNSKNKVQL